MLTLPDDIDRRSKYNTTDSILEEKSQVFEGVSKLKVTGRSTPIFELIDYYQGPA